MGLSLVVAALGCYLGFTLYTRRTDIPQKIVSFFPKIYRLVANKFYVDELYRMVFVNPLMRLKDWLAQFDAKVIDGIVNLSAVVTQVTASISGWFDRTFVDGAVNLVADGTFLGSAQARRMQGGRIQNYLYYALGGLVLVLLYRIF